MKTLIAGLVLAASIFAQEYNPLWRKGFSSGGTTVQQFASDPDTASCSPGMLAEYNDAVYVCGDDGTFTPSAAPASAGVSQFGPVANKRTGDVAPASGDYTAAQVTNTPAGNIAGNTVQLAINELDTEKAPLTSPSISTSLTVNATGPGYFGMFRRHDTGVLADCAMGLATSGNANLGCFLGSGLLRLKPLEGTYSGLVTAGTDGTFGKIDFAGDTTKFLREDGTFAVPPSGGMGADANAYYLVGRATNAPTNAINLGTLSSGLLNLTTSAGVVTGVSSAVAGTDYVLPDVTILTNLSTANGSTIPANKTLAATDDARFTDTRTPTDASVTEAKLNFSDVTTGNASATKHGLLPKLPGDGTLPFCGDGTFSVNCKGAGGSGTGTPNQTLTIAEGASDSNIVTFSPELASADIIGVSGCSDSSGNAYGPLAFKLKSTTQVQVTLDAAGVVVAPANGIHCAVNTNSGTFDIASLTEDATPDAANDYVATYDASAGGNKKVKLSAIGGGAGTWGSITGTLSSQTDLQTALDGKQAADADLTTVAGKTLAGNGGTLRFFAGTLTNGNIVIGDSTGNLTDSTVLLANIPRAASAYAADNVVLRSDGTGRGTQASGVTLDDSNNMTIPGNLTVNGTVSSGDGTVAGESALNELTASGTNYISWLAPDAITDTLRLKFPDANPAGSVLQFGTPSGSVSQGTWVKLTRMCEIHIWGTGASSVLQDTDDEVASCFNGFGVTETITAVRCYANAGSPTVTPIITGGAADSILTGALTCGTASFASGTLNGTPTLASTGSIDANITTAGGTATNIRLVFTLTR